MRRKCHASAVSVAVVWCGVGCLLMKTSCDAIGAEKGKGWIVIYLIVREAAMCILLYLCMKCCYSSALRTSHLINGITHVCVYVCMYVRMYV